MTSFSLMPLPKNQFLLGYNHSFDEATTSVDTHLSIHTIQLGFIFFILQAVRIKEI
jgi:hypothetical protein